MNTTFRAIKYRYTWLNMRRDIEEYMKQCKSCQMNKTLKPKKKAPMEITSTASHPFDKRYLDVVGPLLRSATGSRYILTFQDDLSKYVVATPISQQDAETVTRVFVSQVVLKYGTPSIVHTDQGANFVSEVFKNTCKLLKIKKNSVHGLTPGIAGEYRKKAPSTFGIV
jgi:Integrase core domain.